MQKDPAAGEMQFVSGKLFIPAMQPGLDKNAATVLFFGGWVVPRLLLFGEVVLVGVLWPT